MEQNSKAERDLWSQFDALQIGTDWDEDDLLLPHIMIEDAWGDSHPGSIHLFELSKQAAIGVYKSGGKPAHYHTTDLCDGCAQGHRGMNFILPSREVMADMIEIHGSCFSWDGVILSASCDKAIPAHLIAAARLDLPTVFIPGGSMRPAPYMGTSIKAGEISLRQKREEAITEDEVREYKLTGCPSCGACQFMGTASTMQCMAEALGLALPGSAVAPATMTDIKRLARRAGHSVMKLKAKGITSRSILTQAAIENAVIIHAAIGGSTNATIHMPAIAKAAGLDWDNSLFDRINRMTPHLAGVTPSGIHPTEAFYFAGGVPMVQWLLRDMLDLDVITVTGETLGENLEKLKKEGFFERNQGYLYNYSLKRNDVIANPDDEGVEMGSIAVLKGNLAPQGAVIKYAAVSHNMMSHTGCVKVYDSEEGCHNAVVDGSIDPGDVLVIRYEGPRGSGMPEMLMTTEAIMCDERLKSTVVLITDGRFSGGTRGPCVGHISPEGAMGGAIALLKNNDMVKMDIDGRSLDMVGYDGKIYNADECLNELTKRRKTWQNPIDFASRKGVFGRYTRNASSAMDGAGLD